MPAALPFNAEQICLLPTKMLIAQNIEDAAIPIFKRVFWFSASRFSASWARLWTPAARRLALVSRKFFIYSSVLQSRLGQKSF